MALLALESRLMAGTVTVDPTKTFQTIEGLGGAVAFYTSWVRDHPYKQEIYTNAFAGLNLSMLRLGDWYRYQTPIAGFDTANSDVVSNANRIMGRTVPVYMSSWAPPAFLKSNGQTGEGGTLLYTNGSYVYTNFAQYWYDSLNAYKSNGVAMTWISIQNEPDFAASYDSCRFDPTEDTVNGTNYASYAKALDATYQWITNFPSAPKILAPECVGLGFNDVQNYAATMNTNSFYGVAHHLYGGSTDGSPDGYYTTMAALTNVFPAKPKFMTEYGYPDLMNTACLIHDCLTVEQASGFNYWSLIWPTPGDALVQIEDPYNLSSWTNAPPGVTTDSHGWWLTPAYWAMKHYSYYIQPGYRRVSASDNDNNVRSTAFLSPDNLRLVVVLINTNATVSSTMNFNFGAFGVGQSSIFQTAGTNTYAGTNTFLPLGSLTNQLVLPPQSVTTLVLNELTNVGTASNPSPANTATGVPLATTLTWTPGSNALTHAIYLGVNSNDVAQATASSPEYQGVVSTTNFTPSLVAGVTYYWRVDEVAGINTQSGAVWSFTTVPASANFVLYTSDAFNSTSFNVVGNWVTNGTANPAATAPYSGGAYNTGTNALRTPTTGNATFGGATLTLSAGAPAADGSLLLKGPNAAVVVVNNLIMAGGTLAQGVNSGASGIEWLGGNINVISNSVVSGLGTTTRYIGISSEISGSASISNDCNVVYTGNNSAFTGPLIVGSGGTIQAGSQNSLGGPGSKLVLNNGTLLPTASFTIGNPGGSVVLNSGGGFFQIGSGLTLAVSNPITGSGNLTSYGGGVLQVAGANTATGNIIVSNGTLAVIGTATFNNSQLTVSNTATLDVTALTVPLTISNQLSLSGSLLAEVNKAGFTSLLTASNITYGGTLTLSNLGPALAYGDTIKLFSASNYSGAFSGILPATPGTGLLWYTNWLAVNGSLFVTSTNPVYIKPPVITGFGMAGNNLTVTGTNGNAPGTAFLALSTTNLTLPVSNWVTMATNLFGSGGGFNITNTFDSSQPQQFFMIRLP